MRVSTSNLYSTRGSAIVKQKVTLLTLSVSEDLASQFGLRIDMIAIIKRMNLLSHIMRSTSFLNNESLHAIVPIVPPSQLHHVSLGNQFNIKNG